MLDHNLKQFATERQWEILEAVEAKGGRHGGKLEVAKELGASPRTIRRARLDVERLAAERGYSPDHDMTHITPAGYGVKGTSTLYDSDGNQTMQWVKTAVDKQHQEDAFREAVKGFCDEIPRSSPVSAPHANEDHLLTAYIIGDHHLGMYAHDEEVGENYDNKISENLLNGAMDYLIKASPKSGVGLIAVMGDFFHYDGHVPETPMHHNKLDADSRPSVMIRVGIRCIRYAVQQALKKHHTVRVDVIAGNHDLSNAIFLAECLAALYEDEPRIDVETSPSHYHYYRFGKNLIGLHHGHGVKMDKLPLVMAADRAEDWGQTEYRYWWTGHIHTDSAKDIHGTRVESFRILPPEDAWAHQKGYRSGREMKSIILHKEFGEYGRNTVNPAMLSA